MQINIKEVFILHEFIPKIHRYEAKTIGFIVNAFLVETENKVVAIDSALAVSDVNNIIDIIDNKIGKKLAAVLLTHGHPDHYTGAGILQKTYGNIPIVATKSTSDQCRMRDEEESRFMGSDNVFGANYPKERAFPDTIVEDGHHYTVDGLRFVLNDLGPCESDNDVLWTIKIEDVEHVFSGDIAYNRMHTFFRDGHTRNWLRQIDRCIQKYDFDTIFHTGHGNEMGIEMFYWQRDYMNTFLGILNSLLEGRETLTEEQRGILFDKMGKYLPTNDLMFLLQWQFDDTLKLLRKEGVVI